MQSSTLIGTLQYLTIPPAVLDQHALQTNNQRSDEQHEHFIDGDHQKARVGRT